MIQLLHCQAQMPKIEEREGGVHTNQMGIQIEPYRKKSKLSNSVFLHADDEKRIQYEVSSDKGVITWNRDVAWMLDVHLSTAKNTSKWAGWNAKRSPKIDLVQKVWYLPPNKSITDFQLCGT